ncbi:HpcH/HpaI aldolase/citrate lyase family protein [Brucella gallinifaecis]|uniref:HpcH/HpaI aldolase family protein n=1 Tax=Brucella gallinifaecis TaxID=215590 RepID=UPI00235F7A29|nr:aldolase/citrate lyase family protein [Brucella gallinifaecis]
MTAQQTFRQRFLAREHMVGTFLKIPTSHTAEIIGSVGFEFVIIDEEHAPFDRVSIDMALLGARAAGTAGLVRIAEPTHSRILACLDDGAAGVLVPHISSADKARGLAAAFRYRGGKRGFSNTTRAGDFGAVGLWDHVSRGDDQATFIAMIEDPEALDEIDAIVATEGLDGVFIGRGDLTVAMGAEAMDSPEIIAACQKIMAAARAVNKPIAIMAGSAEEAAGYREMGASAFVISGDQGFLRSAAASAYKTFSSIGR